MKDPCREGSWKILDLLGAAFKEAHLCIQAWLPCHVHAARRGVEVPHASREGIHLALIARQPLLGDIIRLVGGRGGDLGQRQFGVILDAPEDALFVADLGGLDRGSSLLGQSFSQIGLSREGNLIDPREKPGVLDTAAILSAVSKGVGRLARLN